jgi:nucleoside-diphosphate-sugar epimerase
MQFSTNQVLVTGALGWLGISLVEALVKGLPDHESLKEPARDSRIRCLVLPGQDPAILRKLSDRIEVQAGDIRNTADCEQFCRDAKGALLFHTAGIIHPGKVAEFYQINVDGTKNLPLKPVFGGPSLFLPTRLAAAILIPIIYLTSNRPIVPT